MNRHIAVAVILALALSPAALGNLIIDLTGTSGSPVISFVASGSYQVTGTSDTVSSSFFRMPSPAGSGTWVFADEDIADFLAASFVSENNLALSSPISYMVNSVEFRSQIAIDLLEDGVIDHFQLDAAGAVSYPALAIGDTLSWSGSGTFTLTGGNTFDDLNLGSFSDGTDYQGGEFIVNISAGAPVPEPSALALVLLLAGAGATRRRRRS